MFDQMIHDIHHWNRISQYFQMNFIKNKISKMSNLGKVNFFSPIQPWHSDASQFPKWLSMKQFLSKTKFYTSIRIELRTIWFSRPIRAYFQPQPENMPTLIWTIKYWPYHMANMIWGISGPKISNFFIWKSVPVECIQLMWLRYYHICDLLSE